MFPYDIRFYSIIIELILTFRFNLQNLEGIESNGHSHSGHGHSHMPVNVGDDVTSALRGLLIVLALSIHELFEGLAVGLESSTSNVW